MTLPGHRHLALAFLAIVSLLPSLCQARVWQTVIDHNIVRRSTVESLRYSIPIEADPFFFPQDGLDEDDDDEPVPRPSEAWVTLAPTVAPSSVPSDAPSLTPTAWDIDLNGGCRQGLELYDVHMYDSWGDGWDPNTYVKISGVIDQDPNLELPTTSMQRTITNNHGGKTVSIFRTINLDNEKSIFNPSQKNEVDPLGLIFMGSLRRGSHEVAQVCLLPKRCYQITVGGGDFLNEVSWDLRKVDLQARYRNNNGNNNSTNTDDSDSSNQLLPPVLGGGAPAVCTMSLPDEYGHHFCANLCKVTTMDDQDDATTGDMADQQALKESSQVLQKLQKSNIKGSSALDQATGDAIADTFGTTRSPPAMNDRWGGIRGDGFGSGSMSVLGNFQRVQERDEAGDT